jgi:hypothetical protein
MIVILGGANLFHLAEIPRALRRAEAPSITTNPVWRNRQVALAL